MKIKKAYITSEREANQIKRDYITSHNATLNDLTPRNTQKELYQNNMKTCKTLTTLEHMSKTYETHRKHMQKTTNTLNKT